MIFVTLSKYPDLFAQLSAALVKHEPNIYTLLIQDGTLIQNVRSPWMTIRAPEPFNYARNVNIAWTETAPHDVILCGDDVRFSGPFVKTLRETAYSDEKVGVACAQLWGQSPFVCGYFKRSVIEAVGKMDERFDSYGMDDVDWCKRMEILGYRTQPIEIPASHTGGTSFYRQVAEGGESVQAGSERMHALFNEKWGIK